MKTYILTTLLCVTLFQSNGQTLYTSAGSNDKEQLKQWREKISQSHLHTLVATASYPDQPQRKHLSYEESFDKNGNLIEAKTYNQRGRIRFHNSYKYDSLNRQIELVNYRRNGKILRKMNFEYDDSGNLICQKFYWKNATKIGWQSTMKYNDRNQIVEWKYFYPNDYVRETYLYSYYPDGSKKQNIQYDDKGKIIHMWNFECNPEGSLSSKKSKDTSNVCIRYETDKNGNKITIKEELLKQGRTIRKISRFNKNGSILEYSSFDKEGIVVHRTKYEYDKENNLTGIESYKKDKLMSRYVYEGNSSGLPSKETAYIKSDKPAYILTCSYETY